MGFDIPMNTKGCLDLNSMIQGGLNQQTPNSTVGQANTANNMNNIGNNACNNGYNNGYNTNNNMINQQTYNTQQAPVQNTPSHSDGGVILKKGQKTSLTKMNPNLSEIDVCLGWDIKNQVIDLDASAFMLNAANRVVGDDWFVFYGQTSSPDGSVIHHGDSRDGAGAGDDEVITIKLNQVNSTVQKIAFVITINEALENGYNFSMVANAYVRIVDKSTGKELAKFNLTDYYSNVTSMVVGEVYRKDNEWRLNPVGDGVAKDLAGLCAMYGVNVQG